MNALILVADGFEDLSLFLPWYRLREEGAEVRIVGHSKATGYASKSGYPVPVDAQAEAVDIWYKRKARALEIVAEITKLPPTVVEFAYGQTVQMLHGLTDDQIDSLVLQLKLTKESGFLKADIWDSPDRMRKEFFWKG